MLKYVTKYGAKFAMDILPSVAATIIGAYIVNHYIAAKPATDAPAAVSAAESKAEAAKVSTKTPDASAVMASIPEAGVKAKGISEKAIIERSSADKEKPVEKSVEKPADKPAETASIPAEPRRQPAAREKPAIRVIPLAAQPPVQTAAPVAPVAAAPNPLPSTEASPEDRRDANDLARAAIERLRGSGDAPPRAQEAIRAPDTVRVPEPPRVASAPAVRPLPPPIMVSTPARETFDQPTGSTQIKPPFATDARTDDPRRPTPPADIPPSPPSRPLDLRAEAAVPVVREHTSVAEDVLSAAKSVFHAVLPK